MEEEKKDNENNYKLIAQAIVVVGVIIAGAILLSGSKPPVADSGTQPNAATQNAVVKQPVIDPVTSADETLGQKNAPVTVIMYEDYQCPFCGAVTGEETNTQAIKYLKNSNPGWTPFLPELRKDYVDTGKVLLVYRDYAILGAESERAAEAAHCAADQEKFWQYHDYLFGHQGQENSGTFSDTNLKSFAKTLGLDTTAFNQCLDSSKYQKTVADSLQSGNRAMPSSTDRYTPKGFILKNGKLVDIIQGAQPASAVIAQVNAALK